MPQDLPSPHHGPPAPLGSRPCPDRRRACGSPSFFGKIRRFLGPEAGDRGDSGWDNHPHGLPTIDEAFVNFRSIGGAISMHGPMNAESAKAQYRYADGAFFSGEINMALALNDIGEGDGATESFAQLSLSLASLPRDSEC